MKILLWLILYFFGRPAVRGLSFFSWIRGPGNITQKTTRKVAPFLQTTLQNDPQREKNLKNGPHSRRLIFRILGETDNLMDLQTVLNSEDVAFCAHFENRYF